MTNLEAKQEAIRKAYGEHWDNVKDSLDENGWCDTKKIFGELGNSKPLFDLSTDTMSNYHPIYCYFKRPKSLQGIDNNNGFTRIEPDGSNLPIDDSKRYNAYLKKPKKKIGEVPYPLKELINDFNCGFITHFKPIEQDLPPIY